MRIQAWHATKADFTTFAPFSHFGSRTQAEMRCPPGGRLIAVELTLCDPKTLKDRGHWKLNQLRRIQAQGYDSIQYLNRYEGIPLESFDRANARYKNFDLLSDALFQKALPEASLSWIVFDPAAIKILGSEAITAG